MTDERYTFEQARIRLEEIAAEVRKKDTSLERSLDLLEEGVRLANICTELVDHPELGASTTISRPEIEDVPLAATGEEDSGPCEPEDAEAYTVEVADDAH